MRFTLAMLTGVLVPGRMAMFLRVPLLAHHQNPKVSFMVELDAAVGTNKQAISSATA